nr:hypothetical protein [uncultured Prevotella sp.]
MVNETSLAKVEHTAKEGIGCGEGSDRHISGTRLLQYPSEQSEGMQPLTEEGL